MTSDSSTEQAARAEAEQRYPLDAFPATFQHVPAYREAFEAGAAWALAHQAPATEPDLRTSLSTWLTLALDIRSDGVSDSNLLALRDWIDSGCIGPMPEPDTTPATEDEAAPRVGQYAEPWDADEVTCDDDTDPAGYWCTREIGHSGIHAGSDGDVILSVWEAQS